MQPIPFVPPRFARAAVTAFASMLIMGAFAFPARSAAVGNAFAPGEFTEMCRYATAAEVRAAIRDGADVNELTEYYDSDEDAALTPLMAAAGDNPDPRVLGELLAAGARLAAVDRQGGSALFHAASLNPNPEAVRRLLRAGARVNRKDSSGVTPLMAAVANGNSLVVIELLLRSGADVTVRDATGGGLLHLAREFPAIARALVAAGADVDMPDDYGVPPLFMYRNPTVLAAMLKAGADPDILEGENGEHILAYLLGPGFTDGNGEDITEAFRVLLAGGASVNPEGAAAPPVVRAAAHPQPWGTSLLKILLRAGADVNARVVASGATALLEAARGRYADRVVLLIEAGADLNTPDNDGRTALMEAARAGSPETVTRLAAAGADVNRRDAEGRTALMLAVCCRRTGGGGVAGGGEALVRALLAAGADPDARDSAGDTPLVAALRRGTAYANVRALLDGGANPSLAGAGGETPLEAARAFNAPGWILKALGRP